MNRNGRPFKIGNKKAVDEMKASFARVIDLGEIRVRLKGHEHFIPITDVVVTERTFPRGTDVHFFLDKSADYEETLLTFDIELGWKFVPGDSADRYTHAYSEDTTLHLFRKN
ncbi:MAG: hypothetical protein NUV80_07340 [Candidatus Berkelbacteria bacterium]|nr:hypothetical protein [Candidatus Berkelbacteria bacterium]MCR4308335.1 hypothetical protein [Candidatus Berkelbacteria bacterium]